jgi:hypothetical protein
MISICNPHNLVIWNFFEPYTNVVLGGVVFASGEKPEFVASTVGNNGV